MDADREATPPPVPETPVTPAAPVTPVQTGQPEVAAPALDAQPVQPEALSLTPETRAALERAVQSWNTAFAARSTADIAALYDKERYNRLPGVPRGYSYNSAQRELERRFRAPWLTLISRAPSLEIQGALAVSRCEQLVAAPDGVEQGVRTLWWHREADGNFRVVGSEFRPAELGLAANYLEDVSNAVSADLEAWRKAWGRPAAWTTTWPFILTTPCSRAAGGQKISAARRKASGHGPSPLWCSFPAFAWSWTSAGSALI